MAMRRYYCSKVSGNVDGIDLGTTNSCAAVMEGQAARDREQRGHADDAVVRGVQGV